MRKNKNNLDIDIASGNLPAIRNKSSSAASSPIGKNPGKQIVILSVPESIEFSRIGDEIPKNASSPREIQSIMLKSNIQKLLKKIQVLENSNKDLAEELKKHKVNDDLKNAPPHMIESINLNKKNKTIKHDEESELIGFSRDSCKRYKYKEIELLNSKIQNEDYERYVDDLLKEISWIKTENNLLKENIEKVTQALNDTRNRIKGYQNNLKSYEIKLAEKENEIKYKLEEIKEVYEMLKKSEDNIKNANEYNNSIEVSLVNIQEKEKNIEDRNESLQREIEDINTILKLKETVIVDLLKRISTLESCIEIEKLKYANDVDNFTRIKENYELEIEKNKENIKKLEENNYKLSEGLIKLQNELKQNTPLTNFGHRSYTGLDCKSPADLNKEEISRWHTRFVQSERELYTVKETLEKYKKDDIYFRKQIKQKDIFIEELEKILRTNEKDANLIEKTFISYHLEHIGDLILIANNILKNIKDIEMHAKCTNCFSIATNNFIFYPCSHMCCLSCKDLTDSICMKCSQTITDIIPTIDLNRISEDCSNIFYELENMRKLLNYQQFT